MSVVSPALNAYIYVLSKWNSMQNGQTIRNQFGRFWFTVGDIRIHINITNYDKSYNFTLNTEGFNEEYNKFIN